MTKFASRIAFLISLSILLSACTGTRPINIGIQEGNSLQDCPDTPNCVSSNAQQMDEEHYIKPIAYSGDSKAAWNRLQQAIKAGDRSNIIELNDHYLYAEYTSLVFRFVDDVEFLLDDTARQIHVRSASRIGRSDFGVNRSRVESIRETMSQGE